MAESYSNREPIDIARELRAKSKLGARGADRDPTPIGFFRLSLWRYCRHLQQSDPCADSHFPPLGTNLKRCSACCMALILLQSKCQTSSKLHQK
jgi:hypothetical protein